ncbi:uncharacterized protein [Mytilus edulis]|uniref:uncharacterized protein n=1 Tax=Mytilus edulis TaxID=6550 RepID=UPI0039F0F34C
MASTIQLLCGPCGYDDATKEARRWCTNCDEGLCEDCEKAHIKHKILRNHKIISIEDYRKIEKVSISEVCENHGENLEWFCKTHDKSLCMVCVTSNHKPCSDVISINIASRNASQSAALSDFVGSIDGTLSNLKQCIEKRVSATKEIEKQELEITKMIIQMRKKINSHLDKMEEKLLLELGSISRSCKSEYAKILRRLKSAEEKITKLREQTLHIKQFSSDIQVFLGTYQGNKSLASEIKSIKDAMDTCKDYELRVDLNSQITKMLAEVQEFGQIKVSDNSSQLHFRDHKIQQAQIGIPVPFLRNVSNIQLQLITTSTLTSFRKSMKNRMSSKMHVPCTTGCIILPNGNLLIANSACKSLIEYSDTGEHIRDIQVSGSPCCIAVVDSNRIVVTYGTAKFLDIMNNITFKVEEKISFQKSIRGVSQANGRLYVVTGCGTINILDLSGRQLETLEILSNSTTYLTTSGDRIFYYTDKVHCCLMNGEELWKFESKNLICPRDAAADGNHNVYVVDFHSNNLTIIQHDGKDSKILLTESDGLESPRAVYYDNEKRTLLICNQGGTFFLYKVV